MDYSKVTETINSVLTSNLVGKFIKFALERIEETTNTNESISQHLQFISNWSEELKISDLTNSKKTKNVYVNLDTYIYPRSKHYSRKTNIPKKPLLKVLKEGNRHVLISGQPGSGKTTSMKFLCNELINDKMNFKLPILIRIRELNNVFENYNKKEGKRKYNKIIYKEIEEILGIRDLRSLLTYISASSESASPITDDMIEKEYERKMHILLNKLSPIIIIDGVDEIFSNELRDIILKNISTLSLNLDKATHLSVIS